MLIKRNRKGLTAIEYGVFAAFIVLMLVGAAVVIGPQLKTWLTGTITCITDRHANGTCA
ncbi:MAG TPA: Flp family type IVb pilin [Symbiobacteriaceae bacterium]|nr:Flp family type IVb pilin [Symbiobacteriaceae bacterium]